MPFGLAQGPMNFTALMQKVFCQLNDFCCFYANDELVHSSSENNHLENMKMIFLKGKKQVWNSECAFFKRHIQYVGHLILGKGIYPLTEKVETILILAPPRDVTKTRYSRTCFLL